MARPKSWNTEVSSQRMFAELAISFECKTMKEVGPHATSFIGQSLGRDTFQLQIKILISEPR